MYERYGKHVIVALAALVAAAGVYIGIDRRGGHDRLEIALPDPTPGEMQVYITGAVTKPGVYEVQPGERVIDVLYQAGGPSPDADLEALGLAQRLSDEDTIVVPRAGQASSAPAGTSEVLGTSNAALIDINAASVEELTQLPGIGEVYSQRIVDSRTTQGPFESVDDLATRRIIPNATFERIRELITVGP